MVEANFWSGAISSDGGLPLLREVDQRLGLPEAVAGTLPDPRSPHCDPVLQTALERDTATYPVPPFGRLGTGFESRVYHASAVSVHRILVEQFIAPFKEMPTGSVPDFDATDDIVHGNRDGRHFSGYHDNCCFLPLYVFCGEQLLTAYLRPAKKGAVPHAAAFSSCRRARYGPARSSRVS